MIRTYHGTSSRHIDSILSKGILPRNKSKVSNYSGDIKSKLNLVYLSKGYSVFYAQHALRKGDKLVVFQVDVEDEFLYPDEDFLAHLYVKKYGGDLTEATKRCDPIINQHLSANCLELTGNACHLGLIEPKQIVAYKEIPISLLIALGGDSNPMVGIEFGVKLFQTYEFKLNYFFEHGEKALREKLRENFQNLMDKKEIDKNFL